MNIIDLFGVLPYFLSLGLSFFNTGGERLRFIVSID